MQDRVTTKTPHRICLTGGSDLLPYVERHGGDSFGATIDKFVTVAISRRKDNLFHLRYPEGNEIVDSPNKILNPIVRQALISHKIKEGVDIFSRADIPLGSGLGSSGAFTVGLLNALHALKQENVSPRDLAEEAADLEINQLGAPIGKQDQYFAAYGGFLHLAFDKDGSVTVNRIQISPEVKRKFEESLVLVFSGAKRSTINTLEVTAKRFKETEVIFDDITLFRQVGNKLRDLLIEGRLNDFAYGLRELMIAKKKCFVACSNETLDRFVEIGYGLGAVGAKIVGAGGGGFLYFCVPKEKQSEFKKGIEIAGGTVFPFSFVEQGSQEVDL